MSHALEYNNGKWSFAFTGSRDQIWHRLGNEITPAEQNDRQAWLKKSGLCFDVIKVPALVDLSGADFDPLHLADRKPSANNRYFLVRRDNGHVLGICSEQYKIVQPSEVYDWFTQYITVDERFSIDAAGVLHSGEIIWATAKFNGDLTVAGDSHKARLLMSTSFDSSAATTNRGTTTRAVCKNTISAAFADKQALITTSHRSRFDGRKVAEELATIAQSFATYKQIGDAMAGTLLAVDQVSQVFKAVLDIPFDAKKEDISARKLNQFDALNAALQVTKRERNSKQNDAWATLQAITRYVDHDRSVRSGHVDQDSAADVEVGRFAASQFGSGDAVKGKGFAILTAILKDAGKLPVAA